MPDMSELLAAERKKVQELEAKLVEAKDLVTYHLNMGVSKGMPYTALRVLESKIHKL